VISEITKLAANVIDIIVRFTVADVINLLFDSCKTY